MFNLPTVPSIYDVKVPTHFAPPDAWCRTVTCEWCVPHRGEVFCYKVQPNDTLDLIASKQFHGTSGQELCSYNQLKNCSEIGWEDDFLRIPIGKRTDAPLLLV